MIGLMPYCVIIVIAIIFRVNDIRDDGRCFIGLKRESSLLLIIYDLVINVFHSFSLINKTGISHDPILIANIGITLLSTLSKQSPDEDGQTYPR